MIVQYIKRIWSRRSGTGGVRQVPGVVVEVVGETIRELKDVRVAKEGLVATEKRGIRHKRDWRRGNR
ncbi:hypothetical protein [Methanoculleus formosensis]|uniref:hypothetical protein n=1 Tax=Methanoculleus formosensis TaxID=2590886 RepID=UPI0021BF3198|nr:hypothetical protein [Methanoculleus sp. Afa-1]